MVLLINQFVKPSKGKMSLKNKIKASLLHIFDKHTVTDKNGKDKLAIILYGKNPEKILDLTTIDKNTTQLRNSIKRIQLENAKLPKKENFLTQNLDYLQTDTNLDINKQLTTASNFQQNINQTLKADTY